MTDNIKQISPKEHHNYAAFFLTLACNLKCPYCINLHDGGSRHNKADRTHMDADAWIKAANRLKLRNDLPLTLQGGEPTLYKDFYRVVNEVKQEIKMDLMTNLRFEVDDFIKNVPVERFTREAPYAAIRVSYHPGQNNIDDLVRKTVKLQEAGFRIGLYGILQPDGEMRTHILETQEKCLKLGIDFRTKEFLGEWKGKLYGTFKFEGAVMGGSHNLCECRTTELLVDPAGYVYRCHSDLYEGRSPIAHILEASFTEEELEKFRPCEFYGNCNPCDVKVKTDRFQVFGHTSCEIQHIKDFHEDKSVMKYKEAANGG